jgi:hypothetical protein
MLKRLLICLLISAAALPLSAVTVSFLVIETGINAEGNINEHSFLWENSLMNEFFEAGYIVTNAPILRLPGKPAKEFPDEAREELTEAAESGTEYFIVAMLDYPPPVNDRKPRPQKVSLRLFKINPYKFIYEQQLVDKPAVSAGEDALNVKRTIRSLMSHLNDN